jgi:nitrogen regulatory protein PII
MKMIDILVPLEDLDNVKLALLSAPVATVIYSATEFCSKGAIRTQTYRGVDYPVVQPTNAMITVIIEEESLDHVLNAVDQAIEPGERKKWELFVSSVDVFQFTKGISPMFGGHVPSAKRSRPLL